ncbi:hypothetical protein VP01_815g2 [Puccinia sorghi]|uniref:Uncharacterized protein n=1 Tax=Puccinia sorghi TaxID=27349 RepID=A0A0L6UA31_9BASI|nr:hypothetical protein VP01_815g2 [Puccinia sorghi]
MRAKGSDHHHLVMGEAEPIIGTAIPDKFETGGTESATETTRRHLNNHHFRRIFMSSGKWVRLLKIAHTCMNAINALDEFMGIIIHNPSNVDFWLFFKTSCFIIQSHQGHPGCTFSISHPHSYTTAGLRACWHFQLSYIYISIYKDRLMMHYISSMRVCAGRSFPADHLESPPWITLGGQTHEDLGKIWVLLPMKILHVESKKIVVAHFGILKRTKEFYLFLVDTQRQQDLSQPTLYVSSTHTDASLGSTCCLTCSQPNVLKGEFGWLKHTRKGSNMSVKISLKFVEDKHLKFQGRFADGCSYISKFAKITNSDSTKGNQQGNGYWQGLRCENPQY